MNAIYISLPFLQFALSLFLASIVIFSDAKDRRNRLFVLFLVATAIWGIAIFGMRDAFPNAALALSWERVALAAVPFTGIFFYHFVAVYTGSSSKRILVGMYGLGVASAILSLSGQSATGMVVRFYGFAPHLGWAFGLVLISAYPPVALAIYQLTKARNRAAGARDAAQFGALRLAAILALAGGTSDFIPSLGIGIYPMGVVGNITFVAIATWAVVRYRLMDLRLVLRRGLAYTTISSLVFGVYGLAYGVLWLLAQNLSATALAISAFGAVVIVGIFVQPFVARVQAFIDKLFFRERLDRMNELALLNEVTKDITDLPALTATLAETIRRTVQSDWAGIVLPDRTGRTFSSVADTRESPPRLQLPRGGILVSRLEEDQAVLKIDAITLDEQAGNAGLAERATLKRSGADIVMPLVVKGSLTGIITVGPKLVGSSGFSGDDIRFLKAAADQAAMALENSRLYASARREAQERTALAELGRVVNSTLDIDDVFQICEEQVRLLIPYDRFVITTVDHETGTITDAFVRGRKVGGWEVGHRHPIAGSPLETVITERKGLILGADGDSDAYSDYPARQASEAAGLRSMLAAPLISRDGVIGTMNLKSSRADAFEERHLALAERVGAQIATAIGNSQHYERTLQLAAEREARARLDTENRELQRVNEAKSKFLSMVSHELKTPLASVLGFTDILMRNRAGNLQPRQLQHLEVMERNGRHLNTLINDLVDVARVDSGNLSIDVSEFDARQLVEELAQSFTPILEGRSQTLAVSAPESPLYIEADRDRIAQVLTNLVSNASKYSAEGSTVEFDAWAEEERVYFRIKDHGIGISREDQKKLFTAFFRAENEATRSVGGTGLGLVITKNIVELHGGEISVQSKLNAGTTIQFYVKRLGAGSLGARTAAEREAGDAAGTGFNSMPEARVA